MTYTVEVERDDDVWIADVPSVPGAHTQAANLVKLDEYVREVIALVLDLPQGAESDLELEYAYQGLSPEAMEAVEISHARAELEQQMADLLQQTNKAVESLVAAGWSVRDVGPLVGVSPGRVSQIMRTKNDDAGLASGPLAPSRTVHERGQRAAANRRLAKSR